MKLAWRIQQWGPPDGKGWLDWEAGLVDRLSNVLNVYNAMQAYASSSDMVGFLNANPGPARAVGMVLKLRFEHGYS